MNGLQTYLLEILSELSAKTHLNLICPSYFQHSTPLIQPRCGVENEWNEWVCGGTVATHESIPRLSNAQMPHLPRIYERSNQIRRDWIDASGSRLEWMSV